jgi:hypothetical protein
MKKNREGGEEHTPKLAEAALRTIGVSSLQSAVNKLQ